MGYWKERIDGACPVCDAPLDRRPKNRQYPEDGHDLECAVNGCYEEILDDDYGNRVRIGDRWFSWGRGTMAGGEKPPTEIKHAVRKLQEKINLVDPQQKIFLKAIKENPYDQVTRLVYADWLEEHGMDDEAHQQRRWTPEVQKAEERLRDFAEEVGISYATCIQAGHDYANHQDYFTQYGREDARNAMTRERSSQWWADWCLVTGGNKPKEPKYGLGTAPFSCSC